jgi:hypothetical protein
VALKKLTLHRMMKTLRLLTFKLMNTTINLLNLLKLAMFKPLTLLKLIRLKITLMTLMTLPKLHKFLVPSLLKLKLLISLSL